MNIIKTLASLAAVVALGAALTGCTDSHPQAVRPVVPFAPASTPAVVVASPAVSPPASSPASPAPSVPTYPACATAIRPGQPVALTRPICLDSTGSMVALGAFACADGTSLVTVDAMPGLPAGWYVTGQPYRTGTAESDPAYRAAYDRCKG